MTEGAAVSAIGAGSGAASTRAARRASTTPPAGTEQTYRRAPAIGAGDSKKCSRDTRRTASGFLRMGPCFDVFRIPGPAVA